MGKLDESRAKLRDWLERLNFTLDEQSGTRWVATPSKGSETFNLKVTAHRDGSMADYKVCNSKWNYAR